MRICVLTNRGGVLLSALIMFTVLALFSCGNASNHTSSSQLAAALSSSPPPPKSIALTGPGAGGGGLDNLNGGGEELQVEPWYDADAGETINIVSGEAIINLAFDFSGLGEDPQVNVDLLDAQFAQEPTVQALQAQGYQLLEVFGEVYGGLFRLPAGASFQGAFQSLPAQYPNIVAVGPNDLVPLAQARHPNDPWYNHAQTADWNCQWGFNNVIKGHENYDVDAPEAWYLGIGSDNYVVAVIDTGVQRGLIDLNSRLTTWGLSNDNWTPNGGTPRLDQSSVLPDHGTNVAGLIGAVTDNAYGVAGGCWNGKILPCQVARYSDGKFIRTSLLKTYRMLGEAMGVYQSTRWHPELNIIAINMSYASPHFDYSEAISLHYYLSTKAVCVAGAGNDSTSAARYPAAIGSKMGVSPDYVIGVAGYEYDGTIMPGSNFGPLTSDISAPGQNILTVDMYGQDKRPRSGTSMAAPFVSAIALLKKSKSPFMSARFIHNKILQYRKTSPPMQGNPTPPPSVSYYLVMGGY